MRTSEAEHLTSLYPFTHREKEILNYLNNVKNIKFAFEMNSEHFIDLVRLFINLSDEKIQNRPKNYFQLPGIILLMQGFIAKLRLRPDKVFGPEMQLLNQLPQKIVHRLIKIAPGTVLHALFELLLKSPKHQIVLNALNHHPIVFANMLLNDERVRNQIDLFHAVSNPIALKILASEYNPVEFITKLCSLDLSRPISFITTNEHDKFYAKINDPQLRIFTITLEPLIRSAASNGTLDNLYEAIPKKFLPAFKETIILFANMNPMPLCLIPYLSQIAFRFSFSIFDRISDPYAFIRIIRNLEDSSPFLIDEIAKQVVKTPGVWPLLSKFSNDFPFLLFSLRFYYPHMLQCDQDKCIQLLYHAILTDPTAANIINKLYPLLPKSFPAILNCSLYGPISLRTAARVCISDDSMWSQLILFHSMHGNTMEIFKNIIADIIDSGDKLTALHLFNIFIESNQYKNENFQASLVDFAYNNFKNINNFSSEHQKVLIHVLARINKFNNVIIPIISKFPEVSNKILNLIIRYLWDSLNDENPSFLIFRLKLLLSRIGTKNEPSVWSEEFGIM